MVLHNLIEAQNKALQIFEEIKKRDLIKAGKTEKELKDDFVHLANELFKIKKFWHRKIVRVGQNTQYTYHENPPERVLQEDDILFFDFGPVLGDWEADIGKTFVLGNDQNKLKLASDIEKAWNEGRDYYMKNKSHLTGSDFFHYTKELAKKYGWEYGNNYCGHLIGRFPHEKLIGEEVINYMHPDNDRLMCEKDKNGNERFWIYEIHFIDRKLEIGGFIEKLLY